MIKLRVGIFFIFTACGIQKNNTYPVQKQIQALKETKERGEDECPQGLKAFETYVHPLLRNDCIECHDAGKTGPPHSVTDVRKSYAAVLAYQYFDDIPNSRFVQKGGNSHCLTKPNGHCKSTYADIERVVREWWEQGEKSCPRKGKYFTRPVSLPEKIPTMTEDPAVLRWNLDMINPKLEKSFFELEVQQLAAPTATTPGAYQFRKPRVITKTESVHAAGIRLLINGKFNPQADAYLETDMKVTAGPVSEEGMLYSFPILSSAPLVTLQEQSTGDLVSLSFEKLSPVTPISCKHLDLFQKNVLPVMATRQCYFCHSGGPDKLTGVMPKAAQRLSMNTSDDELCAKLFQWTSGADMLRAPLIDLPLRGSLDHPQVLLNGYEIIPAWTDWIRAERN